MVLPDIEALIHDIEEMLEKDMGFRPGSRELITLTGQAKAKVERDRNYSFLLPGTR